MYPTDLEDGILASIMHNKVFSDGLRLVLQPSKEGIHFVNFVIDAFQRACVRGRDKDGLLRQ